MELKIIL